jgi:ribosomal protein S18 acetylase RimI-like enzyme
MSLQIESRHDLSPNEIEATEDRLNKHNSHATGRYDGQGLGFLIRNDSGRMIGVTAGYTWSDTAEIKQMWVDEAHRGRGFARALLDAFIAEASDRGVRRVWVSSYDFQAPALYEKAGFERVAEFGGWPEGHINVILCKILSPQDEWRQNRNARYSSRVSAQDNARMAGAAKRTTGVITAHEISQATIQFRKKFPL